MGKTGILPSAFLQRLDPMTHGFDSQKQPDKNKIRPRPNLIFMAMLTRAIHELMKSKICCSSGKKQLHLFLTPL